MGVLDGERYEGKARFLSPGTHTFVQTSTGHDLVVFWAQASIAISDRPGGSISLTVELDCQLLPFSSVNQDVISKFNCSDVRYSLEVNADRATPGR
jgi:hypothetical protein